jgi:hypothetical protein
VFVAVSSYIVFKLIDLVIPRGGEGLIRMVVKQSTIPVIKHYTGNCHVYLDRSADAQMAETLLRAPKGTPLTIFSPIVRGKKGEYRKELEELRRDGFVRVRIDGQIRDLGEEIRLGLLSVSTGRELAKLRAATRRRLWRPS